MDTVVAVPLPSCAHGLSHYHGRRGLLLAPPSVGTTSFSFVIPNILTPLNIRDNRRRTMQAQAFWKSKPEKHTSVPLEPIIGEEHLNTILSDAEQAGHAVIIDWMASWCRKCIYLKPKLEKIAAEFYPEIKFFYVDVNSVPKALVDRGGVSKMPTIQLWKNGKKEAEVIGGHKAWMVIDEIREMIKENH